MREIIYKYNNGGLYETEQSTAFGDDTHLKIIIEPHEFSIAIGGDVLRSSSCEGYSAVASNHGEVVFYDNNNNLLCSCDESDNSYKNVIFEWQQNFMSIKFGFIDIVDYYPNCDGEYDRWGKEWITQRLVKLNTKSNSIEIE